MNPVVQPLRIEAEYESLHLHVYTQMKIRWKWIHFQPVPEKMRLEMAIRMQNEIQNTSVCPPICVCLDRLCALIICVFSHVCLDHVCVFDHVCVLIICASGLF